MFKGYEILLLTTQILVFLAIFICKKYIILLNQNASDQI
jgi:hypothetical protein